MCIPFGGMGGMGGGGGSCCPTVPPPNAKCVQMVKQLKILMLIQICIGIVFFFVDIFNGLTALMVALFIYMAYNGIDFCSCMMYIFMVLYNIIYTVNDLGYRIQSHAQFLGQSGGDKFLTIFQIFTLLFYIVSCAIVFYAYREFKAVRGGNGAASAFGLGGGGGQQPQQQQYVDQDAMEAQQNQQRNQQQYQAPSNLPFPGPSGNPPGFQHHQQQQQQQQQSSGTFKPFSGKGTTLGSSS